MDWEWDWYVSVGCGDDMWLVDGGVVMLGGVGGWYVIGGVIICMLWGYSMYGLLNLQNKGLCIGMIELWCLNFSTIFIDYRIYELGLCI